MKTTDLCDAFEAELQVAAPIFRDFGGASEFHGPVSTLLVADDNALVRKALEEPGQGRVLVVDNGGSLRCAMVGDLLAALAAQNGWAGIVVNGCVRDSADLAGIAVGIKAIAAVPRRSAKQGQGRRDVAVRFAGAIFTPGAYLYADADGVVLAERELRS